MTGKSTIHLFITIFLLILICDYGRLYATISSVTLTAIDSPTTLSNGHAYFLAGRNYRFRVQASSPDNTVESDWNNIRLDINNSGTTYCIVDVENATATTNRMSFISIADNCGGIYSNIDYTITVRFNWNNTADFAESSNFVRAIVTDDDAPASTANFDDVTMAFGLSTHVDVYNFQAGTPADDGRINYYHTSFSVTADSLIYYVQDSTKTGSTDTVRFYATAGTGEILSTELVYDSNTAPVSFTPVISDGTESDGLSFTIPAAPAQSFTALGDHPLYVRATMSTLGGLTTSQGAGIALNVNRIRIDQIDYLNGGGVGNITTPVPFYRSVNLPGTEIEITVSLEDTTGSLGGNANMRGDTTFTVSCVDSDSNIVGTFTVTVLNLTNTGTAVITSPVAGDIADYTTEPFTYVITAISGSAYDNGQNSSAIISQTAIPLYWDENDSPGINGTAADYDGDGPGDTSTAFTTCTYDSNTATSITLSWTPLTHAYPCYDGDFYTYRIYYREHDTANTSDLINWSPWTMIDRTTSITIPIYSYSGLGLITANTETIYGLSPYTTYDYYITAIDVFGQEVDVTIDGASDGAHGGTTGANYDTRTTDPMEVTVTVTDGITKYIDSNFNATSAETAAGHPDASLRPLRSSTSIRIDIFWASSQGNPDSVWIVLSDYVAGSDPDLVVSGVLTGTYHRIQCSRTAPNKWTAFIPSDDTYLVTGNNLRFIVESVYSGISSFVDHDEETNPGNTNNWEWTFCLVDPPDFTPWPTRMLNNVITEDNPRAYPSYYLTDDAYVTITAYDIKGRPVAVLLDKGFRKAGQNIKEGGWGGTNKFNKKLGVGLYYIRIYAVRASDGKVIIDKYSKVVVAK